MRAQAVLPQAAAEPRFAKRHGHAQANRDEEQRRRRPASARHDHHRGGGSGAGVPDPLNSALVSQLRKPRSSPDESSDVQMICPAFETWQVKQQTRLPCMVVFMSFCHCTAKVRCKDLTGSDSSNKKQTPNPPRRQTHPPPATFFFGEHAHAGLRRAGGIALGGHQCLLHVFRPRKPGAADVLRPCGDGARHQAFWYLFSVALSTQVA